MQRITLVNILATSYSGATWVNLLLGSHPDSFSVGEIDWLQKQPQRIGKLVCSLHESCPFWSRFDLASTDNPYRQIARLAGKSVLIINNPKRLLPQQADPAIDRRWVLVVRDGRAVVASDMRKYDKGAWAASRSWSRAIRKKRRLFDRQPEADRVMFHYELLHRHAEPFLKSLCDTLRLPFDPAMLDYTRVDHHFLGGSPGALSFVAKQQQTDMPDERHRPSYKLDLSHYNQTDARKFKDERWKSQLTARDLRLFALRAGLQNRSLGYAPATDRAADAPTPFPHERNLLPTA